MLLFRRISIENFACFERLEFEPSIDPQKPLTVIRAENGSGKTTLLRAIRWAMYGEEALPGNARNFSLHPATWQPNAQGKTTSVSILFSTDGSSRIHLAGSATHSHYELRRTVRTVAATPNASGAPDFRRIEEHVLLQKRMPDGSWNRHGEGAETVIAELLPWELRDFFVMDADEAADYVGGSENKVLDRHDVIDKTTHAVDALLGLSVFRSAADRLKRISHEFGREATKATGSRALEAQQAELERCRDELDDLEARIKSRAEEKADIQGKLDRSRGRLEALVGNIEAHDQLQQRMRENRASLEKVHKRRQQALDRLGHSLFDVSLYGSLASREINSVRERLQPLYNDGTIPVRHLEFVQSLLERGECVCGQALDDESTFSQRVRDNLAQSNDEKAKADWLSNVLDAANRLHTFGGGEQWNDRCASVESELAELTNEIESLETVKRDIESRLSQVDDQDVQTTRGEIAMLEKQHDRIQQDLGRYEAERPQLTETRNKLVAVVTEQQARAIEAKEHRANQQTTDLLVEILDGAYTSIQHDQVAELDREMNRLFHRMAANVTDDEPVEDNQRKATLAMIARVGLRPLDGDHDKYEIFAMNSRDRVMPPTEINGASRRILALSFVLALCTASKTRAPLVADSLLNFMSGSVRTNTLRVTAHTASQPILLLTGSDLESNHDANVVARHAGSTYTLTGQWQHVSEGGDVVHMTDARKISLLCPCGPREYCSICERIGQSDRDGWTRRQNGSWE